MALSKQNRVKINLNMVSKGRVDFCITKQAAKQNII